MSATSSIWDLWSETAKESETLSDPVFLECVEAASTTRIFDDLTDDKLKSSISIINSLLNDPKTRAKGLTLLYEFVRQINPSRLIGYQDSVVSTLHLVVKGLEFGLASSVLVEFLPKCHGMSEVNQCVTSSIVPKILSYLCEDSSAQRSIEDMVLLKVCLEEFHGPCGHYREKLEKMLVNLIDSENAEFVELLSNVLPFLSYAGGGGNAGEKHSKDWNEMLTKVLKTAYSTLHQLYGDNCPTLELDNPFEGDYLPGLKYISESQVLLRISILKRRLQSLLIVISGYLKNPFPAPKLVPQKGILKLIRSLIAFNPILNSKSNMASQRKETVFLAAVIPGVHVASLTLLRNLLCCVGTNIFIDGSTVEQIITSEFKWNLERPKAFEGFKLQLYETLTSWLTVCGGIITNVKSLDVWIHAIGNDTSVEKDVVELKILQKSKLAKSTKPMTPNSLSYGNTTTQSFVNVNENVCRIGLQALAYIIPSLDSDNHRKIYEHLVKTASIISQFHLPPSPYSNSACRKLLYENLLQLSNNPVPRSPISLTLICTLLRQGTQDSTRLVSSACFKYMSFLERLLHPICTPLSIPDSSALPVALDNSSNKPGTLSTVEDFEICSESNSENDLAEVPTNLDHPINSERSISTNAEIGGANNLIHPISPLINADDLRLMIKEVVQQTVQSMLSSSPIVAVETRHNSKPFTTTMSDYPQFEISNDQNSLQDLDIASFSSDDCAEVENSYVNGNGTLTDVSGKDCDSLSVDETKCNGKRKSVPTTDEMEASENGACLKKSKTLSPIAVTKVDGPTIEEMLNSFVDLK